MDIQTYLTKKVANSNKICTNCDKEIQTGEVFHLEKGANEHLHSLLARTFCSECYAKYGEKRLLKGNE